MTHEDVNKTLESVLTNTLIELDIYIDDLHTQTTIYKTEKFSHLISSF